mgnify:CR=1 FL=1
MLKAVICGMEHSGTTLVSDLLRQSGNLESGFECGVLMVPTPRQFPDLDPFYGFMKEGWSISEEDLAHCCDTDSFPEFYDRLKAASSLIENRHDLFDKTPRYIAELPLVLERTDAPVVMIHKDPRASVYSDYKRSGNANFDEWLETYAPRKLRYMRNCYQGYALGIAQADRVCSISLEQLCFASRETSERMFAHIGEAFEIDYLLLDSLRYKNTRAKFVSADIVLEYKSTLTRAQQQEIETRFAEFGDWFY